ncbi:MULTISPECIES: type II toxin-antitoxin system HicA family toxin [Marinomonas]|uniref:type II toxin-antitoxin system HicA family toxin n=1 Tax=Marinomonas TaxID=28253 RepID=UPI0027E3E448|nr:type II toxin-antitoxin system HicA family toxin [Marinomonas arctica]
MGAKQTISVLTTTFNKPIKALAPLGYEKKEMAGSRVRFYHKGKDAMLLLHKPHPENELKGGALKSVKLHLIQEGWL